MKVEFTLDGLETKCPFCNSIPITTWLDGKLKDIYGGGVCEHFMGAVQLMGSKEFSILCVWGLK